MRRDRLGTPVRCRGLCRHEEDKTWTGTEMQNSDKSVLDWVRVEDASGFKGIAIGNVTIQRKSLVSNAGRLLH